MSSLALRHIPWQDYWELCKPRVIALMLLTAWVGMLLASPAPQFPGHAFCFGTLGIAFSAASAAIINHLVDRRIDLHMHRTQNRPIATGRVHPYHAMVFALIMGSTGLGILIFYVNTLTAWLTFISLIGYAVVYTLFLKHATPQNIVIGGIAGAAPPLLGWTAVTGHIDPGGLLLVLIIFIWTPPHFWALAIYRHEEYAKAKLPMLTTTHGIPFTKLNILFYIVLLILATLLPFLTGMSGMMYLICTLALNAIFLYHGIKLYRSNDLRVAIKAFGYSITYLMVLFVALLFDHYLLYVKQFIERT